MASILLNDEEWDRLAGEPGDLLKLYVGLRRRMDFSSGVAGLVTRIKEQVLRDLLTVDPVRGRHAPEPVTRKKWRAAVARLCGLGLLVDRGNLVFEFPLAYTDSHVQNMRGQRGANEGTVSDMDDGPRSDHSNGHINHNVDEFCGGMNGHVSAGMVGASCFDEGHTSGSPLDRDEMVRAGVEGAEVRAAADEVAEPSGARSATDTAIRFRRLLGPDGVPSAGLQRALVRLAAVVKVREVSDLEMQAAIAEAQRRGVASVVGYALSIIESGSLVQPVPGKVVPMRAKPSARGGSAVLDYLREGYGQ